MNNFESITAHNRLAVLIIAQVAQDYWPSELADMQINAETRPSIESQEPKPVCIVCCENVVLSHSLQLVNMLTATIAWSPTLTAPSSLAKRSHQYAAIAHSPYSSSKATFQAIRCHATKQDKLRSKRLAL